MSAIIQQLSVSFITFLWGEQCVSMWREAVWVQDWDMFWWETGESFYILCVRLRHRLTRDDRWHSGWWAERKPCLSWISPVRHEVDISAAHTVPPIGRNGALQYFLWNLHLVVVSSDYCSDLFIQSDLRTDDSLDGPWVWSPLGFIQQGQDSFCPWKNTHFWLVIILYPWKCYFNRWRELFQGNAAHCITSISQSSGLCVRTFYA